MEARPYPQGRRSRRREVPAWCSQSPGLLFKLVFTRDAETWRATRTLAITTLQGSSEPVGIRSRSTMRTQDAALQATELFLCGACGALNCHGPSVARWWVDDNTTSPRDVVCGSCRTTIIIEGTFNELRAFDR